MTTEDLKEGKSYSIEWIDGEYKTNCVYIRKSKIFKKGGIMESVWIFYAVTFIPVTLFGSIVFILFNLQNKLESEK